MKLCFLTILGLLSINFRGDTLEELNPINYNYGHQGLGKETINSIQANGSVTLEGTKILGLVEVNGSLEADEATINSLQVNGQVGLKNCVINKGSIINGSLTADNTNFQKELSVASQKITLRTCSVDSLTVREVAGFEGVQVVDLRNGTKITGLIVFESGNGEVWLSSHSETSGQISGAKVYKK